MPTPQATLLYRLQTIDSTLTKHRVRLKTIEDTLGQDVRIREARAALAQAEAVLAQHQAHTRDLELEIEGVVAKHDDSEKLLYGGQISNPKELADLQHEVESLDRRRVKLQDDLLAGQREREKAEKLHQAAQKLLADAESAFAQTQAGLISEKNHLQIEQETYLRKRQEAATLIEPSLLARYNELRTKKRGLAVAQLREGTTCGVCGVEQTVVLSQQVRAGDKLILCASCGRILAAQP